MTKQQFVMLAKPVKVLANCDGGNSSMLELKPSLERGKVEYSGSSSIWVGLADGTTIECKMRVLIVPVGQKDWESPVFEWSKEVADNHIAKFGSLPSGVVVK